MNFQTNKGKETRTWLQILATNVVKVGPVPKHVAVIMDGNRRYAWRHGLPAMEGHTSGCRKLEEMVKWNQHLGVKEVTLYAFSIENFKRPPDEVHYLMKLLEELLDKGILELENAKVHGLCVEFLGDWSLYPENLKPRIAKLMMETKDNKKLKLNFAFAYTSRNEIQRSVSDIQFGLSSGSITKDDVSKNMIGAAPRMHPPSKVDIVLRTSGVTRLSDFMLWESTKALIRFVPESFPELSYWRVLETALHYQRHLIALDAGKEEKISVSRATQKFINDVRIGKWEKIKEVAKDNFSSNN